MATNPTQSQSKQRPPPAIIAWKVASCVEAFRKLKERPLPFQPGEIELLEDQLARLSIWTANTGVFAEPLASLDHHLQTSLHVHETVVGLLKALRDHIEECQWCLENRTSLSREAGDGGLSPVPDAFVERLREIENDITRLQKFSPVILRACEQRHDEVPTQGDINQVTEKEEFRRSIIESQIQEQFPRLSRSLVQRLVRTMLIRRNKIIRQRSFYGTTQILAPDFTVKPPLEEPTQASLQTPDAGWAGVALPSTPKKEFSTQENSHAFSRMSRFSHFRTLKNRWYYAPSPSHGITCPYCFHDIAADEIQDESIWLRHLTEDIEAYVCLYEECDTPEHLYKNVDTWLGHMRKHTLLWKCAARSHDEFVAKTKEGYLKHMTETHPGKFTVAQLNVLANRNARPHGYIFEECPFCWKEIKDSCIEGHVAEHLIFLAHKSLPSYTNDREFEATYGNTSAAAFRKMLEANSVAP